MYFFALLLVGVCLFGVLLWKHFFSTDKIDITKFPKKFDRHEQVVVYVFPRGSQQGEECYDVVVVGAGPAGSTLSYYLAKSGVRVLLLEKKKFPRDKYCGDAVCKTAIEILDEMGLLKKLLDENKALVADSGGLCSPGGLTYIGRSKGKIGETPAAIACKRTILDDLLAMKAKSEGAILVEESPVQDAVLDKTTGTWSVTVEGPSATTYKGRVLVCADGATSRLAMKLGVVTNPPRGSCSRAFVEGHKFKADGVVFYHKNFLPGYAALFKHPNNEVNYCCYIIPGNPAVTDDDLSHWHEKLMKEHPYVKRALGNGYKMERMKAASLRLGGEKKTYGDHLLVVGDAAGMIDPMTGEGIHHAMEGGKLAAQFLQEAFAVGNFDADLMKEYQNRWMTQFGHDFKWSMWFCQVIYRYPILMDAATASIIRKGDAFMIRWAEIMTGRMKKINLLRPEFVIVITFELVLLMLKRLIGLERQRTVDPTDEKKTN